MFMDENLHNKSGQNIQTSSSKTSKSWVCKLHLVTTVSTAVAYLKVARRVDLKNSQHKKKFLCVVVDVN